MGGRARAAHCWVQREGCSTKPRAVLHRSASLCPVAFKCWLLQPGLEEAGTASPILQKNEQGLQHCLP